MNSNELQVPPKIELPGFGLDVEFEPYYREEGKSFTHSNHLINIESV